MFEIIKNSNANALTWVNCFNPTEEDKILFIHNYGISEEFISDCLDPNERSRIEQIGERTYLILRIPILSKGENLPYQTVPLGFVIDANQVITICNAEHRLLDTYFLKKTISFSNASADTWLITLQVFERIGLLFLHYLELINQLSNEIEGDLERSIKNKELNKLLRLEKCLVYFITSIKANELVLYKLKNLHFFHSDAHRDCLEDALIENKQALEMAKIYSDIQSGMMDAFASVISNNLNNVMKQLTLISIILMIPTVIASFFGMNVPIYFEHSTWAFPLILSSSILLSVLGVLFFKRRNWV